MTDDLIQRLRADAEFTDDIGLCADAADEIERLREELTALKQSPTMAAVREMITSQAVKENEKLREELTTIKEQRNEAVSAVQRLTEGQPFDAVVIADGIKRGVAATLQKAIETEHAEKQKKIVMLREALESANSALEFSSHGAVKAIHKALAATNDLSGLILCDAEPVAKVLVIDEVGRELVFNLQKPLYTAEQLAEAYEAGKRDATPEWQPIETAPRGVLEILLRSPNGKISNGYWGQECNRGKGAWVWPYVKSEPSHWMPLPAAPKGEA